MFPLIFIVLPIVLEMEQTERESQTVNVVIQSNTTAENLFNQFNNSSIAWVLEPLPANSTSDLTNSEDVRRVMIDMDVIFQYAAVTSGAKDIVNSPHMHVTDNAVMNSLLLREAYDQEAEHFIFPSCTIMYHSSDSPVKEADFNESVDIHPKYYGAGNTKTYLEKMCKFYSSKGKTKFTVLRQSNVYGPGDKFNLDTGHVFAATMVKVDQSNDVVNVWGTGEEERDLIHVSDLIKLLHLVVENQESKFELINAGSGKSVSISTLVKKIISASGKNLTVKYDKDKPTIKTKLAVDSSRAREIFGWRPTISLDSGINQTMKWYRRNK